MRHKYNFTFKGLYLLFLIVILLFCISSIQAQDEVKPEKDTRPVRDIFMSNLLIDNQTVIVPFEGTFEFDIQHRFGVVNNGYDDLFGLYAPSNIRMGFSYVPVKNIQVGFGLTKQNLLWDVNLKYNILQQGRNGGSPVYLTYFVNAAIDTRGKDLFVNPSGRLSYFHQLMVARKVNDRLSVQAAASLSHFNSVEAYINTDREIVGKMKNDHIAVTFMGRYKLTEGVFFLANYDQPITEHPTNNPNPNLSFGIELVSSSHSFQIFAGNYQSILPQYNNVFNGFNYEDGAFLIGFNITRLWNW